MSQGQGQYGVIFPLAKQECINASCVCTCRRVDVCACARMPGNCDHYSITKVSHSNDSCAVAIERQRRSNKIVGALSFS